MTATTTYTKNLTVPLSGQLCEKCKKALKKLKAAGVHAASWAASKAVALSAGVVLGTKAIVTKTLPIFGGGVATVATVVRTMGPVATTMAGGLAAGVAQAVTDAFASMPASARVGRVAVAATIGAAAVSAGAAAALVCGGCGIVVAVSLNWAGQKYIGTYVNGQFGWNKEP